MSMARPNKSIPVEAWTQDAVDSLSTLSISAATVASPLNGPESWARLMQPRGTAVALDIPLDADDHKPVTQHARAAAPLEPEQDEDRPRHSSTMKRLPSRRDSLKRREALLRGQEGSRRRQRWENDRLLGNPHVIPPEPHDWFPRATHPLKVVPYYLAPIWDERKIRADSTSTKESHREASTRLANTVPRELRDRMKRSRAAKSLLQSLEEPVRQFVKDWVEREQAAIARTYRDGGSTPKTVAKHEDFESGDEDGEWTHAVIESSPHSPTSPSQQAYISDSDDEIVFVGRNSLRQNSVPPVPKQIQSPTSSISDNAELDKLVLNAPLSDQGARFARWIVHNIAAYYNLRTWSVTTSDIPARREAYVGIPQARTRFAAGLGIDLVANCRDAQYLEGTTDLLPHPLWALV